MTGRLLHGRWRWLAPTHLLLALAGFAFLASSCASWDGQLDIGGYTTRPNYDMRFKSIFVQVFKNRTAYNLSTDVPGMEMDLTRAIVREIEAKTPYKVLSCNADTELRGAIINFTKVLLNYNPFNQIREAETTMTIELIWRDTRSGEVLTRSARRMGGARDPDLRQPLLFTSPGSLLPPGSRPVAIPGTPTRPTSGVIDGEVVVEEEILDPLTRKKAIPVLLRSVAHYRPELGESLTTALQSNIDQLAVQVVSVMEKGW
jgi:hypothetical protein